MKISSATQAAFALLTALTAFTAGTSAAPIPWERPDAGPQSHWNVPAQQFRNEFIWGRHAPGHHPRLDLQALVHGYGRQSYGTLPGNWGLNRLDDEYPLHPRACGGSPGAGLVRVEPDGPVLNDADEEDEPGEGDAGAPVIATTWNDDGISAPGIQAVPEPGSLALMGAGMLGLLAAGSLRKKKR